LEGSKGRNGLFAWSIQRRVSPPGAERSASPANPEITGSVVAKSFGANRNVSQDYDRAFGPDGDMIDFRIASYVEDIR
jgi:hypothetical protein